MSLFTTIVWENPKHNHTFMRAAEKNSIVPLDSDFVDSEGCHVTGSNKVMLRAYKIEPSTSSININKEYLHRCVDRETVDHVGASVLCNIQKTISRAGLAHALDILVLPLVHDRSIILLTNSMVGLIDIQMPANGVSVESNKDDVDQ